jgi:hypothetical protein
MMNNNMMYQSGGPAPQQQGGGGQQMQMAQQLHQMLAQAGMIDPQQITVEQIAQMTPEEMQQAAQQAQETLQQGGQQEGQSQMAQDGAYTDEESANIFGNISDSLGNAEVDDAAVRGYYDDQNSRAAQAKQASQDKAGKIGGDLVSAGLPQALNMVGAATDKGEVNKGSGASIGSNMASRGGQGAAMGTMFGPLGTVIGAGLGAAFGGVEGAIAGKEYRDDLIENTQSANQVGSLGNSLNIARKGGYTMQASREDAYAKSRANQPYGNFRTSNKLGLNSKIYAAGTTLKNSRMQNGGGTWMEDQTEKYARGGNTDLEAEGGEVVLGDMGRTQAQDGTSITNQSSAGGILKGPNHGQRNPGGSEGVPMNAQDAYIGSKRKTIDGRDVPLSGNSNKIPSNSVAGKMSKILKDIEKIEKSDDRYTNNPVVIERKKQELAKLRDLAELGKMNREVGKLIKQGDSEGAMMMMQGGMSQQQSSANNDMAMRNNQYMMGGHPSMYQMGGYPMYQEGGYKQYGMQGYPQNPNGTYKIDPSWDLAKQRKVATYNRNTLGTGLDYNPTTGEGSIPSRSAGVVDNRQLPPAQKYSGAVPPQMLSGRGYDQNSGGMGQSYNPYGQPFLNTPSPITAGQGVSDSTSAALARPYGERANGGYQYAQGGFFNGKKVGFYANGGYQSGTVSNYNPNTGDFDLI